MEANPLYDKLKLFIEEKIAPGIMAHGGTVHLAALEDNVLTIELSGSCEACSIQAYTSESISNYMLEEFPELEDVIVREALSN